MLTYLFLFLCTWPLLTLLLLPFGVKQVENPEPGHARGAPQQANIKQKMWIAAVLALGAAYGLQHLFAVAFLALKQAPAPW